VNARRRTALDGSPLSFASIALAIAACSSGPDGGASASAIAETTSAHVDSTGAAPRRFPNVVAPPRRHGRWPSPDAPDASAGCGTGAEYIGGAVISNPKVYAVYWTSAVDPNVVSSIGQFYTDILASPYFDLLGEYATVGVTPSDSGAGTNQGLSRGTYGGDFTITPTTTTCTGAYACTLADSQIQAELAAQIAAGTLPAVTTGCDGQVSSLYMFEFPANVTITLTFAGITDTSCVEFCGYHGFATIAGQAVPYGVLPNLESGACSSICTLSASATFADVTSVHSHELAEATTDPQVSFNSYDQYIRPSAWASESCGEIGDECSFQETPITIGADTWTVQRLWSNTFGGCVVSGEPTPVCTAPGTPVGCRACTCSDDGFGGPAANGCDGATPWCETSSSSVNFGDCVACTTSSECSPTQICAVSTTVSTDDVCVACGGDGQPCCTGSTCTAPDTCGGGGTTNVCGCTPKAACPSPDDCGTLPDGCGGNVTCGAACTAPQTCGGGGTSNVCGCTPATSCPASAECGTVPDGCGGTVTCGTCAGGEACADNQCLSDAIDASSRRDAGTGEDSGARRRKDGGTGSGEDASDGGGGTSGESGGCGCRTAGTESPPMGRVIWGGAIGLASLGRLRRRRRVRPSSP
jgi:MYXO-CTERM domain-containing protein